MMSVPASSGDPAMDHSDIMEYCSSTVSPTFPISSMSASLKFPWQFCAACPLFTTGAMALFVWTLSITLAHVACLGLGLGGGGYFLRLHTPFSIPQLMQRVRHQGDCHVISAATEWDPTAMMLGRWRLNPLSHYKTVWPPLQGH